MTTMPETHAHVKHDATPTAHSHAHAAPATPTAPAVNPMRVIRIEKVTVNMGVGKTGDELKKAGEILKKLTGVVPVQTKCKVKIPTWGIREGLPIGVKVTLRKEGALKFLKTALQAKENTLIKRNFDKNGNFGFGIKEYIDLPGVKYDPKMGIRGFDVLVTLERPGFRVKRRHYRSASIGQKHRISKDEAMAFVTEKFGTSIVEKILQ